MPSVGPALRTISPSSGASKPLLAGHGGLSGRQAADILAREGPNRVDEAARRRLLAAVVARLGNPLVLILLGAASVSAFTGDVPSFVIIGAIVLMSVALDVVQEHRAESTAEHLRRQVSLRSTALRDGQPVEVPSADIVPGDVVLLNAGDLVPADGRLIAARDLYVNEALLTGEAFPAEKDAAADIDAKGGLAFPRGLVFMGSSVVSGTARALVTATGARAQLGRIASALRRPPPPTAFAIGIRDFGRMIVRLTVLLVLFVLLVNLISHRPLLQSFLFAIALAVGLTPELLPMVVSVTLAYGARRLSRQQVIVKRLSAIHDLGSMDVLCSDKTGTLTEARIELVKLVGLDGQDSDAVLEPAGAAVICVTHDPRLEVYADRVIHIEDGHILDDTRREAHPPESGTQSTSLDASPSAPTPALAALGA